MIINRNLCVVLAKESIAGEIQGLDYFPSTESQQYGLFSTKYRYLYLSVERLCSSSPVRCVGHPFTMFDDGGEIRREKAPVPGTACTLASDVTVIADSKPRLTFKVAGRGWQRLSGQSFVFPFVVVAVEDVGCVSSARRP
jgi:hypothetical protein